ncbi:MAG: FxsA family protein [Thiobacillaceae bacterium]
MRLWPIVILTLGFPVLEAYILFKLAGQFGWWVLVGLLVSAALGIVLIRLERILWGPRMILYLQAGKSPLAALFASGRMFLAGSLLIFPGVLSDMIAFFLLLFPGTWRRPTDFAPHAANDEVIEGVFRRESDPLIPGRPPREDR